MRSGRQTLRKTILIPLPTWNRSPVSICRRVVPDKKIVQMTQCSKKQMAP